MRRTIGIVALLFISGCAEKAYMYEPAADHPANPQAATAALPPASNVLAVGEGVSAGAGDPLAAIVRPPQADANAGHTGHDEHAAPTAPAGHGGHSAPATTRSAAAYVCPMHPEVTSNDPKARCHICGMFLKPPKGAAR
jgi:hypothetical protein